MYYVDLNSDLGESFGNYTIGMDAEILKYVSSANVACGWHAGDPIVMEKTVAVAKDNGVAVGAHPGFPDLMGFGRRNMVECLYNFVNILFGSNTLFGSLLFNFKTVFIRTRKEHNIVSLHSSVTGDRIARNGGVAMTDVGIA